MASAVKKHISFPPLLFSKASLRAQQMGVTFQDYVRHFIIQDTMDMKVPIVDYSQDKAFNSSLDEAFADIKAGNVTDINNFQSTGAFIESL